MIHLVDSKILKTLKTDNTITRDFIKNKNKNQEVIKLNVSQPRSGTACSAAGRSPACCPSFSAS